MDVQLTLLLEIQDLAAKAEELEGDSDLGVLERNHFGIDPGEAAATLRIKMAELEAQLSDPVRRRYRQIAGHVDRVVAPVVAGTCYGCFVSVATATSGGSDPNAALQTCEHCGRFLYFLT
jgi:hypothetical protein